MLVAGGLSWLLAMGGFALWLGHIGRPDRTVDSALLTALCPASVLLVLGVGRFVAGALERWFGDD